MIETHYIAQMNYVISEYNITNYVMSDHSLHKKSKVEDKRQWQSPKDAQTFLKTLKYRTNKTIGDGDPNSSEVGDGIKWSLRARK